MTTTTSKRWREGVRRKSRETERGGGGATKGLEKKAEQRPTQRTKKRGKNKKTQRRRYVPVSLVRVCVWEDEGSVA
jgi:hypothetical protein